MTTLLTLLIACTGDADLTDTGKETGSPDDTDTDETGDTQETGETADTGTHGTGDAARTGSISLGTGTGTETWMLVGADDEELCTIDAVATVTTTRDDCDWCAFAVDMVLSGATETSAGTCAAAGFDPTTFEGVGRSYGYVPDYYGHAEVVMEDAGAGWDAQGYATWDEATQTFAWFIDDGEISW